MREGRSAQKRIHCKSLLKLNQSKRRSPRSQLLESPEVWLQEVKGRNGGPAVPRPSTAPGYSWLGPDLLHP